MRAPPMLAALAAVLFGALSHGARGDSARPAGAYTLNNITAKPNADGSVTIRFGGDDENAQNTLPILTSPAAVRETSTCRRESPAAADTGARGSSTPAGRNESTLGSRARGKGNCSCEHERARREVIGPKANSQIPSRP